MRAWKTALQVGAVTLLTGGAVLLGASPASADTTILINPGNIPATAAGYPTQECSLTPASPTTDGWVFVLPGNKGAFTSLTLTFDSGSGTVTLTIPPSGQISAKGTKAWISTPAGYTLVAASATVSGASNGFFVLTHTCPATSTPSPSPSTPSETPSSSDSSGPGTSSPVALAMSTVTSPASMIGGLLLAFSGIGGWLGLHYTRRRRES